MKNVLVTGAAGFIGPNLVEILLKENSNLKIVCLDNLNDYYDTSIRKFSLDEINKFGNFAEWYYKFYIEK